MNSLFIPANLFWRSCIIVIIILLLDPNYGSAQQAQFQFFPRAEYLTSTYYHAIHQDEDGFIWIMGNRADRYDGYNFVPANGGKSGLPHFFNEADYAVSSKAVIHQSTNHLIIQTMHDWQSDSISFAEVLPEHAYFLKPLVHELANGQLLFPYVDSLSNLLNFLRLEEGNKLVQHWSVPAFSEQPDYIGFQLLSDKDGHFYTFDLPGQHVLEYSPEGKLLHRIPYFNDDNRTRKMVLLGGSKLLVIKQQLVYEWNRNTETLQEHPVSAATDDFGKINDFKEDENGNFWLCGVDRNLLFYNNAENKAYDFTEELNKLIPRRVELSGMMIDRSGVIWVNTYLGMIKVVPNGNLFSNYFSNKTAICDGYCSFRGITEGDDGDIYASFYGGIMKIDRKGKKEEQLFPDRELSPRGLGWKDGKLLLNDGTLLDPKTGVTDLGLRPLRSYLMDLGEVVTDGKGTHWNATVDSVFVLQENNTVTSWNPIFPVTDNKGRNVLHYGSKSERLWLGDGNRLFTYQIKSEKVELLLPFSDQETIFSIHEDENGLLWLGTEGGLVKYDPSREEIISHFSTSEGLAYNTVVAILPEGDSCLWLSTYFGLSRFNMEKGQFLNFYEQDGLSDNKFNRTSAYKAKDGQMFFGGYQGINAFYPAEVMKTYNHKNDQGQLVLSSFSKIDEKEQSTLVDRHNLNQKSLECYHWNKSITFEFSLSDYKNITQNKYSYFLEGFENDWSSPSKYNFAKYPTIPAGNYTFRVKVMGANGYWNPKELRIPLTVYPPWWQTTWAYLFYIAVVIGLLYMGYRLLQYRWSLKSKYRLEQNEARRLKELDTFKSRLFTNITHEFRTPLTVILGMAEELQNGFQQMKGGQEKVFEDQTAMIQRNGQSLLNLVNRLLDLSKLQHKAYKAHLQNGNVIPLLNYLTSSFQSYANQQDVLLSFKSSVSDLEMDFDPDLLQQLMTNLLSNAIKFTRSGGEITVSVNRLQEEENDYLTIEIEDSGVGIPSSKIEHIFDLFYQGDDSTTRAGEGTGIGLAHSKEIVELVAGRISVESELGVGTVFSIQLPIKNQAEKTAKVATSITPETPLENRPIVHAGIVDIETGSPVDKNHLPLLLLIEDSPDVLTYLKSCLSDEYRIEFALNGRSGIEKALDLIPDLIISDVMMPEKDGFEVCSFLKNDEKTSHIPIILLTAKADVTSRLAGLERGADVYLSKPFHKEELLIRVAKLLDRQRQMTKYFKHKYQDKTPSVPEKAIGQDQLIIEDVFLQRVNGILEKNFMDKDFGLLILCHKLGLSRSQLFRKMKALTGEPPSVYIKNYRLHQAKLLLETTDLNVSEVAWKAGFGTLSHFSRSFQSAFGEAPSATSNQL